MLGRVAAEAAREGEAVVDLGRGNPAVGPPQHVVDAIAERYSSLYGVKFDPETEVSIVPGPRAKAKA